MNVEEMRGGYTTGSSATAGMKAALLLLLEEEEAQEVSVISPLEQLITVPIEKVERISEFAARGTVLKDAGDDPDVTHGTPIVTTVTVTEEEGLQFRAGLGVGTVTKPGLALPVGEPAINPGPRAMMTKVYEEFKYALTERMGKTCGLVVEVSVPEGEKLAKKTLNETLGVVGGISIIGTTGIVKPMSEEGFKNSLVPQLRVMKETGHEVAILVPGRIGQELAKNRLGIPAEELAETSNFIGFMLEQCVRIGFKKIVIIGHLGKMIKLASGSFHTHNRMSDGRMETLAAYAAREGASKELVQAILDARTTEAAMPMLEEAGLTSVYAYAAERAEIRSKRYIAGEAEVGIILTTLEGGILAVSEVAKTIGEEQGWHIPSIL